ncbi:unnamed protein product, partial [Meganyctiphanes norvegica]
MGYMKLTSKLVRSKSMLDVGWRRLSKDRSLLVPRASKIVIEDTKDQLILRSINILVWQKFIAHNIAIAIEAGRAITSDIDLQACGREDLEPFRKPADLECGKLEHHRQNSSKDMALPTEDMSKAQAPEPLFMTAAEQSANYLLDHGKRCCQHAYANGNTGVLFHVMGSALLIRSRLTTYKEALKLPNTKNLNETLSRCSEVVEFTMQSILAYHSDLLHTALLHDADSSDWSNSKPYQENETISQSLLMWAFHLQGLRNDLWRFTSPRISESILASIFTDTLAIMVSRYSLV